LAEAIPNGISFPILYKKGNKEMKKMVFIIVLLILQSGLLNAQQTREEKLEQLKQRDDVKVTEVEKDIIKVEYPNGRTILKNIANSQHPASSIQTTYSPNFDSTIIDLRTIDTTLYYEKYQFWQEVPVSAEIVTALTVADINNNNRAELYGYVKDYETNWDSTHLLIYEYNDIDSSFNFVYTYSDTIIAEKDIYDINKDGQEQLFVANKFGGTWTVVYRKSTPDSLAIVDDFNYHGISQMNDPKFGDYDDNSLTDLVYYSLVGDGTVVIAQYNPATNRLDSLYGFPVPDLDASGFSNSDIDGDGYEEMVVGTIHGEVYIIEYQPGTGYQNVWNGTVETNNAYLHVATDDIDGNGKPEFWVGGDAFYSGVGVTRFTGFEATGNNNYEVVARIDLVGVFSFNAGNVFTLDVDKDGKEEIGVCIDQNFIILKFNGSSGQHSYEVYYIKQNELALSGINSVYYGASMFDITNDGREEILISLDQIIDLPGYDKIRTFTYIYTSDKTTGIINTDVNIPNKIEVSPNYPNPFNPSTNIDFILIETASISIKIYNYLGKEVKLLLEKELSPGNYTVSWDGKGSDDILLPSGVYFIRLSAKGEAEKYTKTIKAVLLK